MEASLSIGDMTMVIKPSGVGRLDDAHEITCHEEIGEGESCTETKHVGTESEACLLMASFLQPDEPGELFQEMFPSFCP